ncbi:MAG: response regulator [Candidatus Niyogibacteria bacterium CG10_big_fil_rev_8_21_14_0_10_46_36]|uniref:Response regulator n=1 Tax=Candidatus Niyogibacteria bacterium CG10_big_fil_rev_8_21_14_0_10_46_36 TaxID=1974726 RepID=A0A2H0TED7_9BACT|nr:MAG: response regulator [Candidatus Niyogibacteria bacterium CG10_big_fil_rev_8_21_14_0_10_46_36]
MEYQKKILIIDDDIALSRVLADALKEHNASYQVELASSGEKGITKAKELKPDLILLDLMMPDLSGVGVMQKMKQDPELSALSVIILSQMSDMEKIAEALALGARGYIIKADVDLKAMLEQIDGQLATP